MTIWHALWVAFNAYLLVGLVGAGLFVLDNLSQGQERLTDEKIKTSLEEQRPFHPVRQSIIDIVGSIAGICLVIVLTWPYGVFLWWNGRKKR